MSDYNLTYLEEGKLRWLDAKGRCMILSESGIINTAQGNPAEFTDGSENYVKSCVCDIVPVQDLHGQSSPYPAGGGKNLFDGVYKYHSTDALTPVTEGETYTISCKHVSGGEGLNFCFYDGSTYTDDTSVIASESTSTSASKTFTVPVGATHVNVYTIVTSTNADNAISDCQIELGSTATAYTPYSNICPISGYTAVTLTVADDDTTPTVSKDYTTELPQTVYGGTLDMVSGVLTIDRAIADLGALTWAYANVSGHEEFYTYSLKDVIAQPESASTKANAICSQYNTITRNQTYNHSAGWGIGVAPTTGTVYVYDSTYTNKDTFTSAMSGVQFVYELKTPVTHQLTPTEILSLYGDNVFSADSGKVTVIYLADTKKYIDNALNS